jgi:acyl-CoA thioesterase I
MMGSDMDLDGRASRRRWLAHCSLLVLALGAGVHPAASAPATARRRILIVGDSLSAEYGLPRGTGWVALLEEKLQREKMAASVINASVSGDTTSGGRTRLPALLERHKPTHVVVELGGNDALRGLPLALTRDNLSAMLRAVRSAGARPLLLGMQMPPNYGRAYTREFADMFAHVAKAEGAALVPFMLAGVADATRPETLFQPDRIHPNAQAQPIILANVWPVLKTLLGPPR